MINITNHEYFKCWATFSKSYFLVTKWTILLYSHAAQPSLKWGITALYGHPFGDKPQNLMRLIDAYPTRQGEKRLLYLFINCVFRWGEERQGEKTLQMRTCRTGFNVIKASKCPGHMVGSDVLKKGVADVFRWVFSPYPFAWVGGARSTLGLHPSTSNRVYSMHSMKLVIPFHSLYW